MGEVVHLEDTQLLEDIHVRLLVDSRLSEGTQLQVDNTLLLVEGMLLLVEGIPLLVVDMPLELVDSPQHSVLDKLGWWGTGSSFSLKSK